MKRRGNWRKNWECAEMAERCDLASDRTEIRFRAGISDMSCPVNLSQRRRDNRFLLFREREREGGKDYRALCLLCALRLKSTRALCALCRFIISFPRECPFASGGGEKQFRMYAHENPTYDAT